MTGFYTEDVPVPPVASLNRVPDGIMKEYFEHVVRYDGMLVQRWTAFYLARIDDPSRMAEVADMRPIDTVDYLSVEFAMDALYHTREPIPSHHDSARR